MMDDLSNWTIGPFQRAELREGSLFKVWEHRCTGESRNGLFAAGYYRHTGGLEPGWSNGWFKGSQAVIFPRGYQIISKEERILGRESDVSECGLSFVASKFWVEVIR